MNAPQSPTERLERAKAELGNGGDPRYAIAHALLVIAELMVLQAEPDAMEERPAIISWQGGRS